MEIFLWLNLFSECFIIFHFKSSKHIPYFQLMQFVWNCKWPSLEIDSSSMQSIVKLLCCNILLYPGPKRTSFKSNSYKRTWRTCKCMWRTLVCWLVGLQAAEWEAHIWSKRFLPFLILEIFQGCHQLINLGGWVNVTTIVRCFNLQVFKVIS